MNALALRASGLTYSYPGAEREALRSLDLELSRGEFVVLAGRSGSGKTTLLRAACGLVPHFHGGDVAGELEVGGLDVRDHGPAELATVCGLVAQDPETQVVSTTVRSEIALPLELRGLAEAERARTVEEVALALAVDGLLDRTTDTLSGGELQRVAIAAALATRPELLLLDEPTSQLDPVAGDELISVLRRLNEELGVTVLLGEHRLERCLAAADRVIALDRGAIAHDGSPRSFLGWAVANDPVLATPAARLLSAAGAEPEPTVREARRALRLAGVKIPPRASGGDGSPTGDSGGPRRGPSPALELEAVEAELGSGREREPVLRGVDLVVEPGDRVALLGRNGAGKTTLLSLAAGLFEPSAGRLDAPGGVALLPQRSGDMILRDRVGDELPGDQGAAALRIAGLEDQAGADPRDLSGGERQRLALAITLAGRGAGAGRPPGAVLMDEPTRGMDRERKAELAELIAALARAGAGVVVATHDVEFAAAFAERAVLLGSGVVAADAPAAELLGGGWYFSTEVARVLDGAALTAERGARLIRSGSAAGRLGEEAAG